MSEELKIGDIVDVHFANETLFNLKILYEPCTTGDCFKLIGADGALYNIQNYNFMVKITQEVNS